jgi:hypothetical protein
MPSINRQPIVVDKTFHTWYTYYACSHPLLAQVQIYEVISSGE